MDCSTPGFPVHHQLLELAQTHVYQVGDAIQPSHPLSSPSAPALNLSQHQGLFQWVSSLHQVAKVLAGSAWVFPVNIQGWFPLGLNGLISFCRRDFQGSSQISQLSASAGETIGISASISVLPVNTQDWSPLGWTGWISLQSKGFSRVFSNTTVQKHQFFGADRTHFRKSHIA